MNDSLLHSDNKEWNFYHYAINTQKSTFTLDGADWKLSVSGEPCNVCGTGDAMAILNDSGTEILLPLTKLGGAGDFSTISECRGIPFRLIADCVRCMDLCVCWLVCVVFGVVMLLLHGVPLGVLTGWFLDKLLSFRSLLLTMLCSSLVGVDKLWGYVLAFTGDFRSTVLAYCDLQFSFPFWWCTTTTLEGSWWTFDAFSG